MLFLGSTQHYFRHTFRLGVGYKIKVAALWPLLTCVRAAAGAVHHSNALGEPQNFDNPSLPLHPSPELGKRGSFSITHPNSPTVRLAFTIMYARPSHRSRAFFSFWKCSLSICCSCGHVQASHRSLRAVCMEYVHTEVCPEWK